MINKITPYSRSTDEPDDAVASRPALPDDLIESIVLSSTSSRLQDQATLVLLSRSSKGLLNRVSHFNSCSDVRVSSPQARFFCSRLTGNDSTITKVDLCGQTLCLTDIEILLDALVHHHESRHLIFSKCKLGDEAGSRLIGRLSAKRSVEHLDLSSNQLSGSSVKSLASFIKQHPELRVLDLGFNFIGDLGFESLFDLVTTHPNLSSVGLVYCGLSNKSIVKIREFQVHNPEKVNLFSL